MRFTRLQHLGRMLKRMGEEDDRALSVIGPDHEAQNAAIAGVHDRVRQRARTYRGRGRDVTCVAREQQRQQQSSSRSEHVAPRLHVRNAGKNRSYGVAYAPRKRLRRTLELEAFGGYVGAGAPRAELTALLIGWGAGRTDGRDRLVEAVQRQLRQIAAASMRRERRDHTLHSTAALNDAHLRLIDQQRVKWNDRAYFYGTAARLMRQVPVDYAEIVELRYFGGLTEEEVAKVKHLSPATIRREIAAARFWLGRWMQGGR